MRITGIRGILRAVGNVYGESTAKNGNTSNVNYAADWYNGSITVFYGIMTAITYTYDEKQRTYRAN